VAEWPSADSIVTGPRAMAAPVPESSAARRLARLRESDPRADNATDQQIR
jgi:hypothetical protein